MGTDTSLWRGVYIIPAVIAIVVSLFSLLVTRESKTFLHQRISYLESPYEVRHPEVKKLSKEEKKNQKEEINSRRQVSSMHWDILLKTSSSYGLL